MDEHVDASGLLADELYLQFMASDYVSEEFMWTLDQVPPVLPGGPSVTLNP